MEVKQLRRAKFGNFMKPNPSVSRPNPIGSNPRALALRWAMPLSASYCENTSHGNGGESKAETLSCQHRDCFVTVCAFKIANYDEVTGNRGKRVSASLSKAFPERLQRTPNARLGQPPEDSVIQPAWICGNVTRGERRRDSNMNSSPCRRLLEGNIKAFAC